MKHATSTRFIIEDFYAEVATSPVVTRTHSLDNQKGSEVRFQWRRRLIVNQESFVTSYVLDDDILVLKLHGKLDATTTPEFNDAVEKHFQEGKLKVIIDCSHLGYVSSFGIGALVSLQAKLRMQGGEVKLAAIQTMVSDIFRIVKLEKLLGIYGDIEFARQSFND